MIFDDRSADAKAPGDLPKGKVPASQQQDGSYLDLIVACRRHVHARSIASYPDEVRWQAIDAGQSRCASGSHKHLLGQIERGIAVHARLR